MIFQYVTLVSLFFRSFINKLRFNLIDEGISLFSGFVITLLFVHIFRDFFAEHLAQTNLALALKLGAIFAWSLNLALGFFLSFSLNPYSESFSAFTESFVRLGENRTLIRHSAFTSVFLLWLILSLACFQLTHSIFYRFSTKAQLLLFLTQTTQFALWQLLHFYSHHNSVLETRVLTSRNLSPVTMRLTLLMRKNFLTLGVSVLYLVLVATFFAASLKDVSFPLLFLLSLFSGQLLTLPVSFLIKEELNYSWLEKNLGTSHAHYINSYNKVGLIVCSLSIFVALFYGFTQLLTQTPSLEVFTGSLKIMLGHSLGLFLLPNFIFQIDARKPIIQLIIVFLVSIFLGSAILFHLGFCLLIPLIKYYAESLQKNRFYRA